VPAFRLLRVGVKLFIRPTRIRCHQENPVFFGEKCLARPQKWTPEEPPVGNSKAKPEISSQPLSSDSESEIVRRGRPLHG
jgi:hypothetical protein